MRITPQVFIGRTPVRRDEPREFPVSPLSADVDRGRLQGGDRRKNVCGRVENQLIQLELVPKTNASTIPPPPQPGERDSNPHFACEVVLMGRRRT